MSASVAGRRAAVRSDPVRWFALACMAAGAALVVSFAAGMWHGYDAQQRLNQTWAGQRQAAPPPAEAPVGSIDPALKKPLDGIDFAITVPKLNYHAAVREGVDQGVLYSGPGHYPESRWPGEAGMVGVAAHNVYWISFPELQPGDEVVLETRYGDYTYRVTGTRIVEPDDRTVLIPNAPGHRLTLTTCWPTWAGAFATQRYIVFTEQVKPSVPAGVKTAA